jgi:hypothetical protein
MRTRSQVRLQWSGHLKENQLSLKDHLKKGRPREPNKDKNIVVIQQVIQKDSNTQHCKI